MEGLTSGGFKCLDSTGSDLQPGSDLESGLWCESLLELHTKPMIPKPVTQCDLCCQLLPFGLRGGLRLGGGAEQVVQQALNKEADGSCSLYEPATREEGPSKFRFHGVETAPPLAPLSCRCDDSTPELLSHVRGIMAALIGTLLRPACYTMARRNDDGQRAR